MSVDVTSLGATSLSRARLTDVDPDFARFVPEEEMPLARNVQLPALELREGPFEPQRLLPDAGGWCGVLVTGMVHRLIQLGNHATLRVLGPAGIIPASKGVQSSISTRTAWVATAPAKIAVIGVDFTRVTTRWPQLQESFFSRWVEQNEELSTQLALSQLPRVEDRVLAMLWLLAESWGKVTSSGILLPLHLTHESIGSMVGARRPTVTLALLKLSDQGAVVQRGDGWLLLEPPPQHVDEPIFPDPPHLIDVSPTSWSRPQVAAPGHSSERAELLELVNRLKAEHRRTVEELRARAMRLRAARTKAVEIRARVRRERLSGRRH